MVSKFPPKKNIPGIILSNSSPGPLLRLPSFLARARGKDPPAAWRRLHGKDGWRGLLDPLHPDLRRELVRYDEFVDAAYGAFLSCPDAEPGRHRPRVALPDAAYRVTAPLFATTSAALPAWLSAAAPCAVQRTSLVGYVAVCDSAAEVRHMGRRDIAANIRRRCVAAGGSKTQAAKASATGSGGRDRDDELEKLRCEREALARLRRGQREARTQLLDVERRVRGTERRQERCTAFLALARAAGDGEPAAAPPVEADCRKRRRIDAGATAAPDAEADFLAFVVELAALAAGGEAEAGRTPRTPTVASAQGADAATNLDLIWNELLGEEMVPIGGEAEVQELVGDAAAAVEPWEVMREEEVLELVQQIGCLASPSC